MFGSNDLDARVRFEHRQADANGDPLGPWVEHITVWARVEYQRGSEAAVIQRLEGRQPVVIDIRDSVDARQITNGFRATVVSGRHIMAGQTINITASAPARQVGFWNILGVAGGVTG